MVYEPAAFPKEQTSARGCLAFWSAGMAAFTLCVVLAATMAGLQGRWGTSMEFRLLRFTEGALWLIAATFPLLCARRPNRIDRIIMAMAPVVAIPLTLVTMNLEMDLFVEVFDPPCGNFVIGYAAKGLWTCVVGLLAVLHLLAQCWCRSPHGD